MGYVAAFIDVTEQSCVVIGGDELAERRAGMLLEAGAKVTVIARALNETLSGMVARGLIDYRERNYEIGDLEGFRIAYWTDPNNKLARRAAAEARERGVALNVSDRPKLCTFIAPAVVKRGALQVAISTGGASPAVAKMLRQELAEIIGEEYASTLAIMASARLRIRQKEPDFERRARLSAIIADELRQALRRHDYAASDEILRRYLGMRLTDCGLDFPPEGDHPAGATDSGESR
jgi:siroheme synthase-like protein